VAQDLEQIAAVETYAPHTDPLARRAMRIRRRLSHGRRRLMARKKRRPSDPRPDPYRIEGSGMAPYLARFLEASAAKGLAPRTVEIRDRMLRRFIA
jgi:hypothetical protein